jgi:hypothetical protein
MATSTEKDRIRERSATYRGEYRGRGWLGRSKRKSRAEKLQAQRDRQRRYLAGMSDRREPANQVIADALLAAYSALAVSGDARNELKELTFGMMDRLYQAGFDPVAVKKRVQSIGRRVLSG